jgi:2-oxoglutarate ferredoxin oxidoreductase subunit gamma
MARTEVILSGKGGQGLILAGLILAEAAGVHDGLETLQTQSYGIEARGGASRSEVVISDRPIKFPEVRSPDIILAMSQEACDKYVDLLKPGGTLVVDRHLVNPPSSPPVTVYSLPLTAIADELGRKIVANVVALGAIVALTGIVSQEAISAAVRDRSPHGAVELNQRALQEGFEEGQRHRETRQELPTS